MGLAYNILSSLFHKRPRPTVKKDDGVLDVMSDDDRILGCNKIKEWIPEFDYDKQYNILIDNYLIFSLYTNCRNNYEKLHMFRIIYDGRDSIVEDRVVRKFFNEVYHLENDTIYQLSPMKYQTVPQYVIDACDKYLQQIGLMDS